MAKKNNTFDSKEIQGILVNDEDFLKNMIEETCQNLLKSQMDNFIKAEPYERNDLRQGQRNGSYARELFTRVGTLVLRVPRDRDGLFNTDLFDRYQRSEKALVTSITQMYIEGVSTRKVTKIVEKLCGTTVSKSQVSVLAGKLDAELAAWRNRPLKDKYPYLIIDARYEYVRKNDRVITEAVCVATGIRADGKREILAIETVNTENETNWSNFFRSLKQRGLSGVLLVISDNHLGLKKAIRKEFPGSSWQRCQAHFIRNAVDLANKKDKQDIKKIMNDVFNAPNYQEAKKRLSKFIEEIQTKNQRLAQMLDDAAEDVLTCFHFPAAHRKRIRTTNMVERLNQEIKRRTRVVRIFPNSDACLRLITACCIEMSENWVTGRKYLDMELLKDFEYKHQETEIRAVC